MDLSKSINDSVWHCLSGGKEYISRTRIRMYSYHEIIAMMQKAGFIDINGYGSMKDEPVSWDRTMMFVIGTKPKK
jgi:hypothetical protein